jgi:hypothetical protein
MRIEWLLTVLDWPSVQGASRRALERALVLR